MVLIIQHRVNSLEKIKKIPENYGIEIDIRSNNNKIILHHDLFEDSINIEELLLIYKHKFLILNIKEDGLEKEVINLMKKFKIENYFLLDSSFPTIVKLSLSGESRIAIRVSEFESFNTALNMKGLAKWIWIDTFTKFPISKLTYGKLKENSYKLCLASPELHGYDKKFVKNIRNQILNKEFVFDAICTKYPEIWLN